MKIRFIILTTLVAAISLSAIAAEPAKTTPTPDKPKAAESPYLLRGTRTPMVPDTDGNTAHHFDNGYIQEYISGNWELHIDGKKVASAEPGKSRTYTVNFFDPATKKIVRSYTIDEEDSLTPDNVFRTTNGKIKTYSELNPKTDKLEPVPVEKAPVKTDFPGTK